MQAKQEAVLLDTLLTLCRERGWLKERGRQRTDSTHVEAAIRTLNRVECVGETLRAALNSLSGVVPEWVQAWIPTQWHERYDQRVEDFRIPKEATKREAFLLQIGRDGWDLLQLLRQAHAPSWLVNLPAVEVLRQVWVQQYGRADETIFWRGNENIPPSSLLISSPYDPDAHMSIKRSTVWTGYKVHLTETCDEETPHLLIHVETTAATTQDMEMTDVIHQGLAAKQLLPTKHVADTGYVDGPHLVKSQRTYGIDLIGPVTVNASWQARRSPAFATDRFQIGWAAKMATCPQGKVSRKWTHCLEQGRGAVESIRIQFGKQDCLACPCRSECTTAPSNPRQLTIRPQDQYEAILETRRRQTTQEFQEQYAMRAGIEGTISQGVRAFDLRHARSIGHAKTHLQHIITATAIDVVRLIATCMGIPRDGTRVSRFASLAL